LTLCIAETFITPVEILLIRVDIGIGIKYDGPDALTEEIFDDGGGAGSATAVQHNIRGWGETAVRKGNLFHGLKLGF